MLSVDTNKDDNNVIFFCKSKQKCSVRECYLLLLFALVDYNKGGKMIIIAIPSQDDFIFGSTICAE